MNEPMSIQKISINSSVFRYGEENDDEYFDVLPKRTSSNKENMVFASNTSYNTPNG